VKASFRPRAVVCALVAAAVLAVCGGASAHAFFNRSEPRAGATLSSPPDVIRIWFNGPIEPVYSTMRVENRSQRVDKTGGRVSQADSTLLELSVAAVPPGRYRVIWSVIARDGHREEGAFGFRVK
jgi:copper resistance protein C